MLKQSVFHHIGVAVFKIEDTVPYYIQAGYSISEIVIEPVQLVRVVYARKEGCPMIELLEPLNETSPICSILRSRGVGAYHICYAVPDIQAAALEMKNSKFTPLAKPVPGHGLDDALTAFFYNKNVGLIQLVEIK